MISFKESLQWQNKEKAFLDTLDLTKFIKSGKAIYEIMDEIEDKYGEQYTEECFIFNNMDCYDFMKYLKEKYKVNFRDINYYEVI